MIRCPRCGAKNKNYAPYCGRCRYPFKKQKRVKKQQKQKLVGKQTKKPKRTFKLPKRLQNINKKRLYTVIGIILIVSIAGFYIFGDKHVDVGGVKFTIPNQFDEKYSDQLLNFTGSNQSNLHDPVDYHLKVYVDDKGNEISIDVTTPSGKRVFSEDALDKSHTGTATVINDQKGYYTNSSQFKYSFEYIKHGNLVCVRANNLKYIKAIV